MSSVNATTFDVNDVVEDVCLLLHLFITSQGRAIVVVRLDSLHSTGSVLNDGWQRNYLR